MTILILITELLSIPSLLTARWLTLAWLIVCLSGITYLVQRSDQPTKNEPLGGLRQTKSARALLFLTAILLIPVGVLAVVAPPSTGDAMEYHLPRVIMWISNHNVRLYPTPDYAQLVFGPAAEYEMLHFYLMWGSDRLVNLVEFFCFLGTIGGVSLIAEQLGAGIRGQVLAAVFVATIPEALLEASGAMNTVVVTFWIVTAVYFVLSSEHHDGWANNIFGALAVGVALLTKGTAYVYLPLLLLACWWIGSSSSRRSILQRLPVLALIVLVLNLPQLLRAYDLTGSPLGMPIPNGPPSLHWMSDRVTPGRVVANVIRNVSLHMITPVEAANDWTGHLIRGAIRFLGQDPNDPATIWPGRPFSMAHFSLHEIHAGNPLHFVMIAAALLLVIIRWRRAANDKLRWYLTSTLGAFLLFCTLLRWQEWGSRHHLPLFALSGAVVGLFLERYLPERSALVASLLLIYALPCVVSNRIRSYVPWERVVDIYHSRSELYFADMHQQLEPVYERIAATVLWAGCRDIGIESYIPTNASELVSSPKSLYVYPLFAMLNGDNSNPRFQYVGVKNLSARYVVPDRAQPVCVVICLQCNGHQEISAAYSERGARIFPIADNQVFVLRRNAPLPEQTSELRH